MASELRQAMTHIHSWAGLILGSLLFCIFWMGSLSVFDEEIDRWMMPDTRHLALVTEPDFDRLMEQAKANSPEGATRWQFMLPTERSHSLRLSITAGKTTQVRELDPTTSAFIPDQGTKAATGFIFPFHFSLNLRWNKIGYWIVGFAGMGMLVILVAGVFAHRKFFAEFFTFRADRKIQRSSLDLHNVSGAAGLPFHFIITLSGLIIFMGTYFPAAHKSLYSDDRAGYEAEALGRYTRAKAGTPEALGSLNAIVAQARQAWGGGQPLLVRVWHPGDANAYVEIRRSFASEITMNLDQLYYDAGTGEELARFKAAPAMRVQRFFSGLHFVQFEHWPLRFFYLGCGLAGCLMIATGLVFWVQVRRKSHAKSGSGGWSLVEGLAVTSICGLIIATLVFFIANRLLPLGSSWLGQERSSLEIWAFFTAWILAAISAWVWPRRRWLQQSRAIAVLAPLAVVLNWLTTGDHLGITLIEGTWAVAGVDLGLLCLGTGAFMCAKRLSKQ